MRNRCVIAGQTLQYRRANEAQSLRSLRNRHAFDAQSMSNCDMLKNRCEISLQSIFLHCANSTSSIRNRFAGDVQSMGYRCAITSQRASKRNAKEMKTTRNRSDIKRHEWIIVSRSVRNRRAIDAQSLCIHCAIDTHTLHTRFADARNRCAIDGLSMRNRRAIDGLSMRNHFTTGVQTQRNATQRNATQKK
jgi:hypothetical protein